MWWYGVLCAFETAAEDLGSDLIGIEYLKTRLAALTYRDPVSIIYKVIENGGVKFAEEGFVKIKTNRERPELDAASVAKFEEWWALYPRKEAKLRSMKAWQRLTIEERDLAVNGARAYALVWSARPPAELRFCPLPYTWLSESRFMDSVVKAKAAAVDPSLKRGEEWLREQK